MFSKAFTLFAICGVALAQHSISLQNNCGNAVSPTVASCIDLAPGTPCTAYSGPQPGSIGPGSSFPLTVPSGWNGRVFIQANTCDATSGDCFSTGCSGCTLTEFNTDSNGNNFYDISNINGFTQSISIAADGCDTVTCTDPSCSCTQAYPQGDSSDFCGTSAPDQAVRGCAASNNLHITFCP